MSIAELIINWAILNPYLSFIVTVIILVLSYGVLMKSNGRKGGNFPRLADFAKVVTEKFKETPSEVTVLFVLLVMLFIFRLSGSISSIQTTVIFISSTIVAMTKANFNKNGKKR